VLAFVGSDLTAESLGGALDALGVDAQGGEFVEQCGGLDEADAGCGGADHASDGGRERGVCQAQGTVAREEACLAAGAMVVGPAECDRAECGEDRLVAPAGVASGVAATAGQSGTLPVGAVGVEPFLQGERRDLQGTAARRRLDGFQIQRVGGCLS